MKHRKPPREKKILSYQKDRVISAEYPHAFRRQWPAKKARHHRMARRKVQQSLNEFASECQADEYHEVPLELTRKRYLTKHGGSVPLGVSVKRRLQKRVRRTAWNFFKTPYEETQHREQFIRFLETLKEGQGAYIQEIAREFKEMLMPPKPRPPSGKIMVDARGEWLRAFFEDEPEWEVRLQSWIERNTG